MIVFTLMFGAVIAFIYSMTYTYLQTQAGFQTNATVARRRFPFN